MSNLYDLKVTLSNGTIIDAGQIEVPSGPTGPTGANGQDGAIGPTGPTGPQVSTYTISITGKNTSGTASNATFYTSETPASGWHITIDDGEL